MKLYVNNQKIDIRDSEFYVSGSEKLYKIDFEFSPDWDGFIKTVIFRKGEDTQSFLLNEPFLDIPSAMLQYPGKISVGVYGQKGDLKKPTEWSCVLDVEDGCKDGNPIEDPDPTIYEQLLEKFELISELDATASVDQTVGEAEVDVTKTTVDDHYSFDFAFSGIKGETGETGEPGFSPSASVEKTGHKATITITDIDGTTTADIYDGDSAPQDWTEITGKPFSTIGSGLTVDQDGELSADVISDWTDIQNKPFETIGSGLSVGLQGEMTADIPTWSSLLNKPFETVGTGLTVDANDALNADVTGVKGNSEANYRTGNVNITPANVGAVALSGDTMTGNLTMSSGTSVIGNVTGNVSGNAGTATKLATARSIALGADFQGSANFDGSANVTINGYHRYCTVDSSNKSNFPWHRIATVSMGTAQWQDADIILDIRHRFDGGAFGRIKLSARTNSTNAACSCTARWMYRYGMAVGSVIIAWWGVTGNDVYADVYYNVGTYARCVISRYEGTAPHEFTLINSNEVADTTSSDKKTSVEVYKDVATAATQVRGKAYTGTSTSVDAASTATSTNTTNIYAKSGSYKSMANALLEMVYPVGSVYMSTVNTSPASFLGGTWTQIKGRFLLGMGSNDANSTTTYGSLSAGTVNRTTVKEKGGTASVQLQLKNYRKRLYIWQGSSGGAGGTAILNGDYIAYGQNYNCWLTDSDNEAFYIMPPYFTVYMWERTA